MATLLGYLLLGLALLAAVVALSLIAIRYERRRILDAMTPEEQREEEVFQKGVFRRRP